MRVVIGGDGGHRFSNRFDIGRRDVQLPRVRLHHDEVARRAGGKPQRLLPALQVRDALL